MSQDRAFIKPIFILCTVLLLLGASSYAAAEKEGAGRITSEELRHELMRFASSSNSKVKQAFDVLARRSPTPEARLAALEGLLFYWVVALDIVLGPNPGVNMLDMVVFVTLSRITLEEYWLPEIYGDQGKRVLEVFRNLEAEIWTIASKVLTPKEQEELRHVILKWRKNHPDQVVIAGVRFGDFAEIMGESALAERSSGFLGIKGATKAVDEARLLVERVLFYVERMPLVVAAQARLLFYEIAASPEMQQVGSNATKLADALGRLATMTEQLPVLIERERNATIDQLTEWVAGQAKDMMPISVAVDRIGGGEQLLDQAFRRATMLILIFLAGTFLMMLAYRYASERLFRSG